ncbi:MAG: LysR family transcriptional regulator [Boseongicola sp.]
MKNEFRNWSDVRVFLSVVREGSTLAASRKLGIAQPTVARRIEALENEVGLTLFERDTRGFKPTENALSLYPLAEVIEKASEKFSSRSRELTSLRPIRITAPGYFSEQATEIFSDFVALNPDTAFEFIHSLKVLNLLEGDADIAIRVAASEPDENLICRKVSVDHWALFGGQTYADKFGLPNSLDDLKGHRFVTFQHDDAADFLHTWLARTVAPDQIIMSFSDLDLMHASVRAGHGLGLCRVRPSESDGALIRCFDNIEELSRPVMMLIAPDAYRRPEVRAFTKFFAPRYAAIFK